MNVDDTLLCATLAIGLTAGALDIGRLIERRRAQRIHRLSFRPNIEIRCHNSPAEAGSTRTPDALARSPT